MGTESDFDKNVRRVQEEVDLLFQQLSGGRHTPVIMGERKWRPPTDVYETSDSLIIICELAGMEESDIEITIEENELSIRGERKEAHMEGKTTYHNKEIDHGPFERSFRIPQYVNTVGIEASCRNGFLEVTLPKSGPSKQIPVE